LEISWGLEHASNPIGLIYKYRKALEHEPRANKHEGLKYPTPLDLKGFSLLEFLSTQKKNRGCEVT